MDFVCIGAVAAVASLAHASAPAVELTWDAPADCPSRELVLKEVSRLLGDTKPAEAFAIEAEAKQRADGGWTAHLSSPFGERWFDGNTCTQVADAAAVIIALMIVPAADPSPSPPALAVGAPASSPSPELPATRTVHALVRPGISVLAGPLPNVSPGAGVAAGVRFTQLRIEVEGAWGGPSQQVTLPTGVGATLSMLFRGGLDGCWTPWSGRIEVDACLGARAGLITGDGNHVDNPAHGQSWWLDIHAGGALTYPLSDWLSMRVDLSGGYSPIRPEFVIENVNVIHNVAAWSVCGGIGAEARF